MRRGWDRGYVLKGRGQLILIVCMVYSLPLQESSTWAEKEVAFISPMDQQRSVAWLLTGSTNVLALSLFPPLFTFLPPPLPSPLLSHLPFLISPLLSSNHPLFFLFFISPLPPPLSFSSPYLPSFRPHSPYLPSLVLTLYSLSSSQPSQFEQ